MRHQPFGDTGIQISALGFGAMRLPTMQTSDGETVIDNDASVAMLRHGFDAGISYVDTAWGYCGERSEVIVGRALRDGYRDRVTLSTKLPLWKCTQTGDGRRFLERQLEKLGVDHIDVYHVHGLKLEDFHGKMRDLDVMGDLERGHTEGLFSHLAFSSHDTPEHIIELIDTGRFASVLCQYNLLDRKNEPAMARAKERGMGVVAMGPVGGGRLAAPRSFLHQDGLEWQGASTPEIALRFVLANPNVDCALSGMGSLQMVDENVRTVSRDGPLTAAEQAQVEQALANCHNLADLYCTGCEYCMPCPQGVHISRAFEAMNAVTVWGMREHGERLYRTIGDRWIKGAKPTACTDCGLCERACPQDIPIRAQLKDVVREFEG